MKQVWAVALLTLIVPATAQEKPRGYLGVMVAPLDAESRAAHGIPESVRAGVVFVEVMDGTAAAKAGLRAGDVVTAFAGKEIDSMEALGAAVRGHAPGDRVKYTVRRGTGTIQGTLILGRRAAEEPRPIPRRVEGEKKKAKGGDDLDSRLDKVQEEIAAMRRRVMEERRKATESRERAAGARRRAGGLGTWMARERELMAAARERGDERAMAHHRSRLGLLEELSKAGVGGGGQNRMARVERKLDRVIELLEKRE